MANTAMTLVFQNRDLLEIIMSYVLNLNGWYRFAFDGVRGFGLFQRTCRLHQSMLAELAERPKFSCLSIDKEIYMDYTRWSPTPLSDSRFPQILNWSKVPHSDILKIILKTVQLSDAEVEDLIRNWEYDPQSYFTLLYPSRMSSYTVTPTPAPPPASLLRCVTRINVEFVTLDVCLGGTPSVQTKTHSRRRPREQKRFYRRTSTLRTRTSAQRRTLRW
jgi:hypothetical protein